VSTARSAQAELRTQLRAAADATARLTRAGAAFEIARLDVLGRTMDAYTVGPRTFAEMLHEGLRHGDRDWFVYANERLSFSATYATVSALARELIHTYGVEKGDRIAVACRNYPEFACFFWAVPSIGAVLVPLNAWWGADELTYGIRDSEAVMLVADGERLAVLGDRLPALELRTVIAVKSGHVVAGTESWEDVRARFSTDATLPAVDIDTDELATILYTSGTTGEPRGAIHTHRNHATNLLNMLLASAVAAESSDQPARPVASQPATLANMPFFHVSQMTSLYTTWMTGAKLVTMRKWDAEAALDIIEAERITAISGVPLQVDGILTSPTLDRRDVSSLATCGFAGTAAPLDRIMSLRSTFAGQVAGVHGYGMTEATSAVTLIAGEEFWAYPTSVGRPMPVNEIKIRGEDGAEVPVGQAGEIWVRGPNVVQGYWNKPTATAAVFEDGWHRSGDVGRMDEGGRVYIVDRIKDIIIRAGENVYCAEVESVLHAHPAVAVACVIGLPHPRLGEEVAAVVKRRDGYHVTTAQIQSHVRAKLAAFKVPSSVIFWDDELPLTATGKIRKRELRDQLSSRP
jgi:acyl-CoA synthetase (AMP-forming)/AMP-acid ligase II